MGTITREIERGMNDFRSEGGDQFLSDGLKLGKWKILAFIAKGGNGEVYRVQNMADGEKEPFAALKILCSEDMNAGRRFENELKYLQQLKGGTFPAYMDKGVFENRPYFVMEELCQPDLPDDDEDVAEFMLQVCKGICELHARNIIHRDIKPDNIMCRKDGTPVIVDLGLCKTGDKAVDGHVEFCRRSISMVGERPIVVGTPGNSAPEQLIEGKSDFSSDVCSLGILARECFMRNERKVPKVWLPIINRATSTIPEQRYQTVKEFKDAIEYRHLNAKGVTPIKPYGRWEKIALICCLLVWSATATLCVRDMASQNTAENKGCYNVRARVVDEGLLWNVICSTNGWKLEKFKLFGNCRILDPNRIRVAWGPEGNMREMFKEIHSGARVECVDSTKGWCLMVAVWLFWISLIMFLMVLQRKWLKNVEAGGTKVMNQLLNSFKRLRNTE